MRKENEWYSDLIDLLSFQWCVIAVKDIFGLRRIDELTYITIYQGNIWKSVFVNVAYQGIYLMGKGNEMKTWRYIYDEFLEVTKMDLEVISDFRPCGPPYYNVLIPMAIIVWLKNGSSLIYISKGEWDENNSRHFISKHWLIC